MQLPPVEYDVSSGAMTAKHVYYNINAQKSAWWTQHSCKSYWYTNIIRHACSYISQLRSCSCSPAYSAGEVGTAAAVPPIPPRERFDRNSYTSDKHKSNNIEKST